MDRTHTAQPELESPDDKTRMLSAQLHRCFEVSFAVYALTRPLLWRTVSLYFLISSFTSLCMALHA